MKHGNVLKDSFVNVLTMASRNHQNNSRSSLSNTNNQQTGLPSFPLYQALTPQIQSVSKTEFENYVKANDAWCGGLFKIRLNLQNIKWLMLRDLLSCLCIISKDSASTLNSGTLPSQTVTNHRQQINAITTRRGKTLEGPSTPLVPTPVVSTPQKEPERNPETSMDKVQKPSSESTAQVPPPEEEDSIFIEIPKSKAKKTINVEIQDPNSQDLTYEDVVVRVDGFTFLADFVMVNFVPDPRVPIILGRPFLRTAKALFDLYKETLTLRIGKEELVYYADKSEKNKEKKFVHAVSIIDFSKDDPFSGSTTIPSDAPFPSSSLMKTSDNFEKFADELAPLDSLPPGNDDSIHKKDIHEETFSNPLFEFDDNFKSSNVNPLFEENDKDVEIKSSSSFTLTSPKESEFEAYLERDSIPPGIDLSLPPPLKFQVAILLPLLSPERRIIHGKCQCFSRWSDLYGK
ncbi:reverse transcriptase domain-containing protein [Tanacetum coccineum]